MAFKVVLDANVLYPFSLRDTLLRLAERELYDLVWSQRILGEVSRNLIAHGHANAAGAARLEAAMTTTRAVARPPRECASIRERFAAVSQVADTAAAVATGLVQSGQLR
jgi:hypothetical protein